MDMRLWASGSVTAIAGLAIQLSEKPTDERSKDSIIAALNLAANVYLHAGHNIQRGIELLPVPLDEQLEAACRDLRAMLDELEAQS